uniref:ZP domain-containing protein n=1 Tax=Syphacia muris TaxID=451379 RepID=A0A0N5AQL7_9BILA
MTNLNYFTEKMLRILLLFALIYQVYPIPINNGVVGNPEIECGSDAITISFNTQDSFNGHVYVKGMFDQDECRVAGDGDDGARIKLHFDTCNVHRSRSLNPRGIFVSASVIISFHPQFVTKVDRAYRIQCFYMEADKTVSADLEISDITTLFYSVTVPMPILDGGPNGEPVRVALVGQQVYHKWTCDSETMKSEQKIGFPKFYDDILFDITGDIFCALVHSCYVNDGNDNRIEILDLNGCATDKYLLNNLEYPTDLMAGQEAHVYKYADKTQLYYQCQISITVKEVNGICPRPECPEPKGFGSINFVEKGNSNLIKANKVVSEEFSDEDENESEEDTNEESPEVLQSTQQNTQRVSGGESERTLKTNLNQNRFESQKTLSNAREENRDQVVQNVR